MTTVFISYAGRDPQWPSGDVRALGLALEHLGATVMLDQFHLERQSEPGKLSPAEWRDWMNAALRDADRVICLVSARYVQAVARNLEETWGYGVAYESLKLIGNLYRKKGRNEKWILTLRPDGAPFEHIPEDFQEACPEYQWPSERTEVLEHASKRRRKEFESNAGEPPPSDGGADSTKAGLVEQAKFAMARLRECPDLFSAIVRYQDAEALHLAPPEARSAPASFIEWLATGSADDAQEVMWAVRTALEEHPSFRSDSGAQEAAIAVYMLCALRWVEQSPESDRQPVLAVPAVGRNVLAVLSAAFFGGRIQYALNAEGAQPVHVYDVRAPRGEAASTDLLRAIYCALFADEYAALEVARRDDDDPRVVDEMVQRLRAKLNHIRRVKKLAFTLIVDQPDAFGQAPWVDKLQMSAFTVNEQLAESVFLLNPHQLDQEIKELLRQIQPRGAAGPSA